MNQLVFLIFCCTHISVLLCTTPENNHFFTQLKTCYDTYLSCASGEKNIYCRCDQMCPYYDDCCFDVEGNVTRKEHRLQEHYYPFLQRTTCEFIEFRTQYQKGILMVSSCPVSWMGNSDIRYKCEQNTTDDFLDLLPVSDIVLDITFKNRHCAVCHGRSDYIPWLLELSCQPDRIYELSSSLSMTDALMLKMKKSNCRYRFMLPKNVNVTVRYCFREFNYTIRNVVDVVNKSICENHVFTPTIIIGDHVEFYRNFQCLIDVFGPTYTELLPSVSCFYIFQRSTSSNKHALSSLIDVSSLLRHRQGDVTCKEKEVHLSAKIGCQRLYCPVGSEPSGGKCIAVTQLTNGIFLDLLFEVKRVTASKERAIYSLHFLIRSLVRELTNDVYAMSNLNIFSDASDYLRFTNGTYRTNGEPCYTIHMQVPMQADLNISGGIASLSRFVYNVVRNFTEDITNGGLLEHIDDVKNLSCKSNITLSNPVYVKETFLVGNDTPCPAVKVRYSDNDSNSDVLIRNLSSEASADVPYFYLGGIILAPSDVIYSDGDYFVCIDTFLSKYQRLKNKSTITRLSWIIGLLALVFNTGEFLILFAGGFDYM